MSCHGNTPSDVTAAMQSLIVDQHKRIVLYLVAGGICCLLGLLKMSGVFDLGIEGLPREPVLAYVSGGIGCCFLAYALYFLPRRFLFADEIHIQYMLHQRELRWSEVTELRFEHRDTTQAEWRLQILAILANIPPFETYLGIRLASGRKLSIRVEPELGEQILTLARRQCGGAAIVSDDVPARANAEHFLSLPIPAEPEKSPSVAPFLAPEPTREHDESDDEPEDDAEPMSGEVLTRIWKKIQTFEEAELVEKVKECLTRAEILNQEAWLNRETVSQYLVDPYLAEFTDWTEQVAQPSPHLMWVVFDTHQDDPSSGWIIAYESTQDDICALITKAERGRGVKCWADDFAEALEILVNCFLQRRRE